MNYLEPFAGLCTENFIWNSGLDAASLGNLALFYNPVKETKNTCEWLSNKKIH